MASNPWEILNQNRLNIPGLMQAAGEAKTRRLQEMMLNRQVEREDRAADREDKLLGIYAKLKQPGSQPKGGGPASGGVGGGEGTPPRPSNIPSGSPTGPQAGQMGAMGGAEAPADPVRVQSWVAANQHVVDEMLTIAPDKAFALADKLSSLDEAQFKRVQEMNQLRAGVAMHLQSFASIPERRAEVQRILPMLVQRGVSPEIVQQELGDLSDAALQAPVFLSMDVEKIWEKTWEQRNKDRTFEETQRHNRATEGVAQGGLAVRQGALEVARNRAARAGGGDSDNSDLGYLLGGD